jgi:hypothetical protein
MKPLRPLRPGQPERRIHDYQRHGTASLLAALDVTVGSVIGRCYKRHRAIEFRRFLDDIDANVALQPDVPIVLDNASRHKDQAHPQLTWPPAALRSALCSDLGFLEVERFFALLTEKQIRRDAHRSVGELEPAIDRFIEPHDQAPSLSDGPHPLTTSLPASSALRGNNPIHSLVV